jgi:hypothetical protein
VNSVGASAVGVIVVRCGLVTVVKIGEPVSVARP